MATTVQITRLRTMVAETDSTTYDDPTLGSIIDQSDGDLDLAAATIWEQKAGVASTLVDVSESGSSRSMSQIYKNARQQAEYYTNKVNEAREVVVDTTPAPRTRSITRR